MRLNMYCGIINPYIFFPSDCKSARTANGSRFCYSFTSLTTQLQRLCKGGRAGQNDREQDKMALHEPFVMLGSDYIYNVKHGKT